MHDLYIAEIYTQGYHFADGRMGLQYLEDWSITIVQDHSRSSKATFDLL